MTWADRETLGIALEQEFGFGNVDKSHSKIHVVRGESGYIDIAPTSAEYVPLHFKFDWLNPFSRNTTARNAVRIIKTNHPNMPGIMVEKMVLEVQRQNKSISLDKLIEKTEERFMWHPLNFMHL